MKPKNRIVEAEIEKNDDGKYSLYLTMETGIVSHFYLPLSDMDIITILEIMLYTKRTDFDRNEFLFRFNSEYNRDFCFKRTKKNSIKNFGEDRGIRVNLELGGEWFKTEKMKLVEFKNFLYHNELY